MKLRRCACGSPVVLSGWRLEDDRPTGHPHVCERVFVYDGGSPEKGCGPHLRQQAGPPDESL